MPEHEAPKPISPLRRVIGFVFGTVLIGTGGWFLYRHLLYGDEFSVTLTLLAFLMVGSGILLLPTAVLGRRDW
jgi:hypothetical protein